MFSKTRIKMKVRPNSNGFFLMCVVTRNLKLRPEPVTSADVELAIRTTRPSGHTFAKKYRDWQENFGSV